MNRNELFYFEEDPTNENCINCFFKVDKSKWCVFYKNILDEVLREENFNTRSI